MADFKYLIGTTIKEEGGKSRDTNDPASKDPVPDGTGYHTNMGITWNTFKGLAGKVGYTATPSLFYAMPMNIFLAITKIGYWDAIGGDQIKSQAIANTFFQHGWGAGTGTAIKFMQGFLNSKGSNLKQDGVIGSATITAINKQPEKSFFITYSLAQKNWFLTRPGQQMYYKGWGDRLDRLYTDGLNLITENPKSSGGSLLLIAALITGLIYFSTKHAS